MTFWATTTPVARKEHYCGLCLRVVHPGESYLRQASMTGSEAWTWKACEQCTNAGEAYMRETGHHEYCQESVLEWLLERHPHHLQSLLAKWRWPDGELMPPPFTSRCYPCGTSIRNSNSIWCDSCNARIEHDSRQFVEINKKWQ